jgi:hypothetical protein
LKLHPRKLGEDRFFSAVPVIILLLLSLLVFLLSWHGLIYGAGSDPRYTLIVSQSILENGTIALDAYANDLIWGEPANFAENFNIVERNGRFYNYFPAGPSILSVPFVAMANWAGWDMRLAVDNIYAQRLLSSLSLVALLWLMAGIAHCFLPWIRWYHATQREPPSWKPETPKLISFSVKPVSGRKSLKSCARSYLTAG